MRYEKEGSCMTTLETRVIKGPEFFWEDLNLGDTLQSPGLTISEAHLVNWAGLTGDIVSLHLDEVYASETQFGQRIGHGPLSLACALGLMTQTGYFKNVTAWLGLDEVRATAPVFIGDTIRATAELIESRETSKPSSGIWKFQYKVINQNGAVIMTFISSFMMRRR